MVSSNRYGVPIGYLLSIVLRLPRSGRAYDCVHFIYAILGPLALIALAASCWPEKPAIRGEAFSATLGTLAVICMLIGFISNIQRHKRWEHRHHAPDAPFMAAEGTRGSHK